VKNTTNTSANIEQGARQQATPSLAEADLRDYFAAKAMQGLLAAQIHGFNDRPANGPFASMAYEMADAMLKEREK